MKRRIRQRPGFSIIELLVVVVILGVLAALALPKYNKSVEETHKREAKTILNIIRSAELSYKIDMNEYYPFASLDDQARSLINIDVYDTEDWQYSVSVENALTATATARRLRGQRPGSIIFLDVTSGKITE